MIKFSGISDMSAPDPSGKEAFKGRYIDPSFGEYDDYFLWQIGNVLLRIHL
jgi:hypothetical protein